MLQRTGLVRPVDEPGSRAGVLETIVVVGAAIGLFTVSWDRLANIPLAGYNVKLPSLVFTVAALAALPLLWRRRADLRGRWVRLLALLIGLMLVVLVVAALISARPTAGVAQIVAVVTGAVAPALAVFAIVRTRADLLWALRWFLLGAAVACVFGLYQLAAFYAGLPQFITYTGVGVNGDAGRIAAFSYEPAYFTNFVVLALGAAITAAVLQERRLGWLQAAAFSVVLVLANVRALYFLVPVLAVLLALRWRLNRQVLLRCAVAGLVVLAADLGGTWLVQQAQAQAVQAPPVPSAAPVPSKAVEKPDPAVQADSPVNVLNPNEQSSNAPRLALYSAVVQVSLQRPILGVGPGNLSGALTDVGYVAPNQGTQVVANNIWLQALADGGVVLVLIEGAIIALVVVQLFRRSMTTVQPLIAAWLAVLAVSGMLTSYFFDVKIWVVLGLIAASSAFLRRREPLLRTERIRAAR